jgi:hypothetical protein
MPKIVRSARGEVIDFDQLKIKEQLASAPTPVEVKARQNFIENRMKRRLKKTPPKAEVEAEPKLPEPAEAEDKPHIEEELVAVEEAKIEVEEKKAPPKKKTRRTRKTTTTEEKTEDE